MPEPARDAVEIALATALTEATKAGRWDVVSTSRIYELDPDAIADRRKRRALDATYARMRAALLKV